MEAPKVIPNVSNSGELPPPTDEAIKIANKVNILRQRFVRDMKDFNQLLSNSILPENKSSGDKEKEQEIISSLTNSASEINGYSNGEGTLGLVIFALRQMIHFKDANNRLIYEVGEIKKKLNIQDEDPKDVARRKVMELAKELGVDVKVDE